MNDQPSPKPLAVVLGELAAADPDRPAITHEGRTVTRSQLESKTNRLARAYLDLGAKPGSMITIGLPNGIEFFEAAVATWKLGATPQPISSRLPIAERDAIIKVADPSLVVGLDPAGSAGRPTVTSGFTPDGSLSDEPLPPAVAPYWKAPASGGSTGAPKLILSTAPAVLEALTPFVGLAKMTPNGVSLVTGPLYHNGPFMTSSIALFAGCHLIVMTRFDPATALELIQKYSVDWMYAVPTMMNRIWRLPEEVRESADLSSLKTVVHTGAPCPPWLKESWINWLGPEKIVEVYAGTETQAITIIGGDEWLTHRGSVGRPVIGEIKILDENGEPLPPGEVGDLWMRRGEGAPAPYLYKGAEAKARDGWESLGDLGWIDDEGYLYLTDRDTDMILVGGANVYPAEVEGALDEHPKVQSSCVIGLPDDDLGNVPHALVQLDSEVSDEEFREHLSSRLASYKIPRSFERVDEPLRDEAGKVRRSTLRAARI